MLGRNRSATRRDHVVDAPLDGLAVALVIGTASARHRENVVVEIAVTDMAKAIDPGVAPPWHKPSIQRS